MASVATDAQIHRKQSDALTAKSVATPRSHTPWSHIRRPRISTNSPTADKGTSAGTIGTLTELVKMSFQLLVALLAPSGTAVSLAMACVPEGLLARRGLK